MKPDFNAPLVTKGGKIGRYMGHCPIVGKHRVATTLTGTWNSDPKFDAVTVWLVNDNGICRCDGAASEYDVINA